MARPSPDQIWVFFVDLAIRHHDASTDLDDLWDRLQRTRLLSGGPPDDVAQLLAMLRRGNFLEDNMFRSVGDIIYLADLFDFPEDAEQTET